MQARCPDCQTPIDLVADGSFEELDCPTCDHRFNLLEDETQTWTAPEASIGRFSLRTPVGAGASGTVWKAWDPELDRIVAVKAPRSDRLTSEAAEQFLREARAVAQLSHPNIVSVHEVGRDEDRVYIVSDFVDGVSLSDWLTARRPTVRVAVEMLVTIADAVDHAHRAGVFHRDLKPGNILLDADEQPHVADFGLARRPGREVTMTAAGAVLGTPAYMSPEQARGDSHDADARSDVYSLGVVLFELLTTERPFRGNTRMVLEQVIRAEAPSPRKLDRTIPGDLETICRKCLEKHPDARYQTAGELRDELRRHLDGEPIRARPVGRLQRGWRWCRRRPTIAALSAVSAVLLLLVAIGGYVMAARESHLRTNLEHTLAEVDDLRLREREARGRLLELTKAVAAGRVRIEELTERLQPLSQPIPTPVLPALPGRIGAAAAPDGRAPSMIGD